MKNDRYGPGAVLDVVILDNDQGLVFSDMKVQCQEWTAQYPRSDGKGLFRLGPIPLSSPPSGNFTRLNVSFGVFMEFKEAEEI